MKGNLVWWRWVGVGGRGGQWPAASGGGASCELAVWCYTNDGGVKLVVLV